MGNHRFRLSDMIPNAWFYKLKDMSKPRNNTKTRHPNTKKHSPATKTIQTRNPPRKDQQFSNPRHSYYFTTDPFKAEKLYSSPVNRKSTDTQFPPYNLPRKSSSRRRRRNKISGCATVKYSSPRISSGFDSTPDNSIPYLQHQDPYEFIPKSETISVSDPYAFEESWSSSWSSSCSCRISSSANDIIIDMDGSEYNFDKKLNGFDLVPPPILTKPQKFMLSEIKNREVGTGSVRVSKEGRRMKNVKEQRMGLSSLTVRKSVSSSNSSPGMKLRSNSPRGIKVQSRKMAGSRLSRSYENKSVSDSFAVVKSSCDPQRDFRESMVEMIIENNIRASNDLEELLGCYLSLNSNVYHDIIVQAFQQIRFDLIDSKL